MLDDANQLQYASAVSVHVWLPPGFPEQPPVVRPMSNIYHPNVTWEGVYLSSAWHPAETLVGLVRKVGDLLAFRYYDQQMVANPSALEWLAANGYAPLDMTANFEPGAGGEPLSRVCRYGQQSIASMKQSVSDLQTNLLRPDAPDAASVREFSHRTRMAVNLFLENDVPDDLRAAATEVDEWAREIAQDVPGYDYLRGRRAAAGRCGRRSSR